MPKTATKPVTTDNGWAYGYRPKPTTRTIRADPERFTKSGISALIERLAPDTGNPFEAEIIAEITMSAQERLTLEKPWPDVYKDLAPYVIGWNAAADDNPQGKFEPLPAPADGGWEVFKRLRNNVAMFIWICLKFNVGGDLPKEQSSSGSTDDGEDAGI